MQGAAIGKSYLMKKAVSYAPSALLGGSEDDHDQHILNTLDTARDNNVKFNPEKFQFKVAKTSFFWLTWTSEGLRPDEKKVKGIVDMQPPQNLTELQSFMGMINYLNRFSPVIAQTSEPLRQLMKKEVPFVWQPEHQKAFLDLKRVALKHQYWRTTMQTKKTLQRLDVDVKYIPGKINVVADAMSRVSHMGAATEDNELPTIEVDTITRTLPATPAKLEEIRDATNKDETLCHLKDLVYNGWPELFKDCPTDLKDYWNYREDLSVENGLVLKGHRLIIPEKLRATMLQLVHQGHMGVEKCLLRAKDCMFWPGISKDIKELTSSCSTCMKYAKQQPKETLLQYNLPSFPWQMLRSDLFDHRGCQYLLLADYFSKFPVIRKLNIINHLKSIFAEHGIPEELVTDNGPQYSSNEFAKFCSSWGIKHTTSSPLFPQSNGFSERMVQTVKNLLRKANDAGVDPYIALINYRTTPVDSKLHAPAKLLKQRERELEGLSPRQSVAVYNPSSRTWTTGEVNEKLGEPRSYVVKTTNGSELRRNGVHLKLVPQKQTAEQATQASMSESKEPPPSMPPSPTRQTDTDSSIIKKADIGIKKTSSGRIVKPPTKLNLFIGSRLSY
ncbi:Uncharacterized protein K02A2.6 [Exaiptasia diaphana]|nr:Uncharacterized protein K02A2.6 [Exaiptasia diaphana]